VLYFEHGIVDRVRMTTCPHCNRTDGQVKAGLRDGTQRYKCGHCNKRYVPEPRKRGLTAGVRQPPEVNRNAVVEVPPLPAQVPDPVPPDTAAKRRATIVEVAEQAGVSVSTISNFLNDKGRMSEATRARIRSAMADLRFTPNSLVKAIRRGRTHIIGVVTYGLFDLHSIQGHGILANMLSGINRGADSRSYNVLLYTGWPHRIRSSTGLDFLDGHIDGLIWVGPEIREPMLEYVAEAGLPAMMLLSRQIMPGVGYVDTDNIGGMLQIMAHLTSLGHKRIAYAGPTHARDFLDRLEGYTEGLRIAGLPLDPALVAADEKISINWYPTSYTPEYDAALDRWLALPNPPTAIVLSTDGWAEWMTGALAQRGVRVPEDMAVTGFDNNLSFDPQELGYTTVVQNFHEIGRLGTLCLANLIDGAPVESCRTILPAEIIVRASSTGTTEHR